MALEVNAAGEHLTFNDDDMLNLWAGGGTFVGWVFVTTGATAGSDYIMEFANWTMRFRQRSGSFTRAYFDHPFSTTGGVWFSSFPADVPLSTWQQFVMTYNRDSVANDPRWLIDGVDIGTEEATTPVGTATVDASGIKSFLGVFGGNSQSIWEDVRYYNRILTDDELETMRVVRGPDNMARESLILQHMLREKAPGQTAGLGSGEIKESSASQIVTTVQSVAPTYRDGVIRTRRKTG